MGTKRTASLRRLVMAVIAASFVVIGAIPQLGYAQEASGVGIGVVECPDGQDPLHDGSCPVPKDEPECPDGQVWDVERGECVAPDCAKDEVYKPETGCVKPGCVAPEEPLGEGGRCVEPYVCWNGLHVATEDECPDQPTNCPETGGFCTQVRSCPTDTPLPPGATCEDPPPTTTAAPPVASSPSPSGDRGTFGRPAVVEGAGSERSRAEAATARVAPESLARTGINEWLAAIGTALVVAGLLLVRWAAPTAAPAEQPVRRRGSWLAALALLTVAFASNASPASAEAAADDEHGRNTAPGQLKKQPAEPVCPEGQLPDNDGGCFVPMCPDGSEIPENGECAPPPCPEGADICDTRSCPVDSPLPPGASCEEAGAGEVEPVRPQPAASITTVNAVESGGGASVAPAVSGSVFGRPAEVLGVTITSSAPAGAVATAPTPLPALAATGRHTIALSVAGAAFVLLGLLLVRASAREASNFS